MYIELQKQFIEAYHEGIYPDMETAHKAFQVYWDILERNARKTYESLCACFNGAATKTNQGILCEETCLAHIKDYLKCNNIYAREVLCVMIMAPAPYHKYITERQGGGIVI